MGITTNSVSTMLNNNMKALNSNPETSCLLCFDRGGAWSLHQFTQERESEGGWGGEDAVG